MGITRRDFLKGSIALGIGSIIVVNNIESILTNSKVKRYYEVPIKSRNPCGERLLCGDDMGEAEKFASYNGGIVNYIDIMDGKTINEGSYNVNIIRRIA